VDDLLRLADLQPQADDPVESYSYGMRRKLSLVEAFSHDPELVVLDEPTSGVDAHFPPQLAELIRSRCERGPTTRVASNDPEWVAGVASR
jgi:ABC-2 type transport system ATP-binding protein